jgi:uncharacterized protein (TIRG00374 family)
VLRAILVTVLSLALGLAGLYLVFGEALFRPETYRVQRLSLPLAALIAFAFLAKWFSPAARLSLLCRGQKAPVPYRSALLVHLTAMSVAALTPNNTGVAPATAAALTRVGVPLGRGIGVVLQVFILDLIFFAWAVPTSIAYLTLTGKLRLPPGAEAAALATAGLAVVAAVVLSRRPRLVVRLILALALAITKWSVLARFAPRMRRVARDYYRSARAFSRMPLSSSIALHLLTVAGWFASFSLLWALLRLYGVGVGFVAILAILTSITLVSHFIPTPGASGFMEAAVALSIDASPGGGTAAALLVWRFASFYVIFLIGPPAAWLLYRISRREGAGEPVGEAHPVRVRKRA